MSDRVSGNPVDARGGVQLLDAVEAAQLLRGDLSGSGLFSGTHGGKGEHAAGADSQHAADDALFAHAHPDQRMVVPSPPQKLDHGNVVGKRSRRADNFVEVSGVSAHLFQSFSELLRAAKVVEGKNQAAAAAQLLQPVRLAL